MIRNGFHFTFWTMAVLLLSSSPFSDWVIVVAVVMMGSAIHYGTKEERTEQ